MHARPAQGAVVACHGHGEEADGYGAGFGCLGRRVLVGGFEEGVLGDVGKGEWGRAMGVRFFAMGGLGGGRIGIWIGLRGRGRGKVLPGVLVVY